MLSRTVISLVLSSVPALATISLLALCADIEKNPGNVESPDSGPRSAPLIRPSDHPSDIDFARDIQPILTEACYECHGPEKKRASLRLDARRTAFKGGVTGPAIKPGDSESSLLIRRIRGLDGHKRMPLGGDPLTSEQIDVIARWIDAGAAWPDALANDQDLKADQHWAYIKPARPEPPAVEGASWIRNPIDNFILACLEKEHLTSAAEADRHTLLRRVYLDLIGMPPSPADADAFLSDDRLDAYERLVDRLLASPHFGERWAQPWLDLARYADSNGYEKDRLRSVWPYRDWVINALNRDMPFDQFTIEQLAGDLLPNPTLDQQIATGFNRNSMINEEGGVDPEESRCAVVVDRVNTTASVWLGSSIQCAQCHNHKFDPFSQKDYYQLFAFFNNTATEVRQTHDNDMIENSPKLRIPLPNESELRARLAALEQQIAAAAPQFAKEQEQWEAQRTGPLVWQPLAPLDFGSSAGATGISLADNSVLITGKNPDTDIYTIEFETDLTPLTAIRLEALSDPMLGPARGPGRTAHGNFVLSEIRVTTAPRAGGLESPVKWTTAAADFNQQTNDEIYDVKSAIDGDSKTGWAVAPEFGRPHIAVFVPAQPIDATGGVRLRIVLDQQYGSQHTLGRARISVTSDTGDPLRDSLPASIRNALATPHDQRNESAQKELADYFRSISPLLRAERDERASIQQQLDSAPTTLVMLELPQPRETHVMLRGNFMSPGDRVQPDVPAALPPLQTDAPRNRLGFAQWLIAPENPLTARVAVNRFWEQYFGRGLVPTSADFGTQGQPPTHPELLDWLATEFVRQGWHMKAMHRLIVTSATYRQSTRATPAQLERDPDNKLLSRAPRFRLDPERLRDQMLTVSGLLSPKIGGPSVMPYQIPGLWAAASSSDNGKWITSTGDDRWRRGLYTFWRRSSPYPSFVTFDAPNRELICTRRSRTNTPLQALTMLNDPECIAAAASLASRTLDAPSRDAADRITYGFRLCLQRDPLPTESTRLASLLNQQLLTYKADEKAASELAKLVPESIARRANIGDAELAAWTIVWNVVLNTDEMLNRE